MSCPLTLILLLLALPAWAQTNDIAPSQVQTNQNLFRLQKVEECRMDCIQRRRTICGKILKVLPEGLVVDSGYTNLIRPSLNRSWLVPSSVQAQPAAHLVEGNQPNCVCVGLVFLTDLPRRPHPKLFDYVNLTAYPTGQYTYTSVGDLRRTVRRFSTTLAKAVQWNFHESKK